MGALCTNLERTVIKLSSIRGGWHQTPPAAWTSDSQ